MRILFASILLLFIFFMVMPLIVLLIRSFQGEMGYTFANYVSVWKNSETVTSIINSFKVSALTALITTALGFVLAYAIHCTNIYRPIKSVVRTAVVVPMLLPTITYGFAIMYSFGNQGLITRIVGKNLFPIYGFNGLLTGYVIYTLPLTFLLLHHGFQYFDKRFLIVSKLMGDGTVRSFLHTVLRPMAGALGGAFVTSFILSFTDFGIPASVGGTYPVIATELYQIMLGSIPDFNQGAVVAILMLIPAVFGVWLLNGLERLNFHYDRLDKIELPRHRVRDIGFGFASCAILFSMLSVFAIMFIAPWLAGYPYDLTFTFKHVKNVLNSSSLTDVYRHSLGLALFTALFGTLTAYGAALLNARTRIKGKSVLDSVAMLTNTLPGMVLGISYLLLFNNSSLKNTFTILVLCNIVHFFTTPYLMAKNALSKMNRSWETTGELLGDSWLQTVYRVILPNSAATVIEMFSYYFVNAMVTISGLIFLVSARTSVVASTIKELQHFEKFNEIFVLSLLIFFTNLTVKGVCDFLQKKAPVIGRFHIRPFSNLKIKFVKARDIYVEND